MSLLRLYRWSALAAAGLCVCAPLPAGGAAEPIRIGQVASLTGKEAAFGQSSDRGTVLAVEQINAAGGVLGRPIQLLTEDNRSALGESASAARKLISRDRVVALLGEVASGRSLEMAPVAQRAGIPMISPSSTNPSVTEKGDCIFRVCFIDPFQGDVLAKFAWETLSARRVAVLSDAQAPYSQGLAAAFVARFKELGGEIVSTRQYQGGDKDFRAQLTAIKSARPDAVFVPGYYSEVGLLARQARQIGITAPLLGGDGWEAPQLIELGGAALEGCYYSTHFSAESDDPAVRRFVDDYRARWQAEPDAMAALGYDSARILAAAISRAGSTEPRALRDAIAATRDFPGVTGRTSLDEKRNARKPAVILTIGEGRFRYVKTVEP